MQIEDGEEESFVPVFFLLAHCQAIIIGADGQTDVTKQQFCERALLHWVRNLYDILRNWYRFLQREMCF